MANTQYAYVRDFEIPDPLLPQTFILFRLDGRSFHRFSDKHSFTKPNDIRALQLMDHAARNLMEEHPDIVLAFGESDEYRTASSSRGRRHFITEDNPKLSPFSHLISPHVMSSTGKILYPSAKHIRDYFAWRQADTHINNLYNTTFWALVQQGGQTTTQAHATLKGTFSKDKHEILFTRFNMNYNDIDPRFRKGSVLYRQQAEQPEIEGLSTDKPPVLEADDGNRAAAQTDDGLSTETSGETTLTNQSTKIKMSKRRQKERQPMTTIELQHCDIIKDGFWVQRRWILEEER